MKSETLQPQVTGAAESVGDTTGNGGRAAASVAQIEGWLVAKIANLTKVNAEEVDIDEPFANFGLNSIDAVSLSGDLEDMLGCSLSATLLWDFPTIRELSAYLAEEASATRAGV
jgi:acyl carrier protein